MMLSSCRTISACQVLLVRQSVTGNRHETLSSDLVPAPERSMRATGRHLTQSGKTRRGRWPAILLTVQPCGIQCVQLQLVIQAGISAVIRVPLTLQVPCKLY